MLIKKITYPGSILILLLPAMLLFNSCSPSCAIAAGSRIRYMYEKKIGNIGKPKVIQLGPSDCPSYKTCKIKNGSKHKRYGDKYAKRQNRRMEDIL